ncbi:MAG: hypothetical protein GY953_25150, partial [bacterium]|nr:hypothetical protein [bacterium]
MQRREFLAATACAAIACSKAAPGLRLEPAGTLGDIQTDSAGAPIPDAKWYTAEKAGDGLSYSFPAGALSQAKMLTTDMLLDGNHKIVFGLTLQEGEDGRRFHFRFSGLNQCSLRMRMPLSLVDQNRWGINREGAFLKPRVSGSRVDLDKVDRISFTVMRKSPATARWCMTDLIAAEEEVPMLDEPLLAKGKLIDEIGQSTIHSWPAKSNNAGEVTAHIQAQLDAAPNESWPEGFSDWGGWKSRRLTKPAGFFRTHHDGKRWWLVDPDGYAFWSAGLDCVRVDTLARYDGLETALEWLPENDPRYSDMFPGHPTEGKYLTYLAANFIRALGADGWRDKWARVALSEMKRMRFNTVGNWSEWEFARAARFPYVRPMHFRPKSMQHVYRDFPDVFHPDFAQEATDYAAQLVDTKDDPALIGYFLMNEPTWGFSSELPAAGMLYVTEERATRNRLR